MPLVESGGFDELRWGDDQLALACASHGGEPEHVAIAERMLSDLGLEEGDLACGPHEPLSARGLRALRDSGDLPNRLHNNCSGKHTAMLARAVTAGWASGGYEKPEHEVQRSALAMVSRWTSVPSASLVSGIDGCGVPVVGMPLTAMALAYARLGKAYHGGEEVPTRVLGAMARQPFFVGGTERFDTVLIEESEGAILSKVGAEGVHSFCVPELGIGGAIKVADGALRAQHVALVHLLESLDLFSGGIPPRLAEFMRRPIRNTRGDDVGEIRPLEDCAAKTSRPSLHG
jgi:L-asparaginase II